MSFVPASQAIRPESSSPDSERDYSSSDDRPFAAPSPSSYVAHQRVTVDTELADTNRGYRLLQKMGWKGSGVGLGLSGNGQCILHDFCCRQCLRLARCEKYDRKGQRGELELTALPPVPCSVRGQAGLSRSR